MIKLSSCCSAYFLGTFLLAACPPCFAQSSNDAHEKVIGRIVESLAVADIDGKPYDLSAIDSSKLVVVAFWGTECPLAKKYASRMQQLSEWLQDDVQFVMVFSNEQDSIDDIKAYIEQQKIKFPVLKDSETRIADQFSARRTPEVCLLDHARTIRYRGRVDDQFGIGYTKKEPGVRYLQNAIEQVLAKKAVPTSETDPIGCIIGRVARADNGEAINFASHVAPILNQHCVACHQPEQIGPMSLTDADEVVGWAAMINEVVREGRMPPWNADPSVGKFSNERRLTEAEKSTIAQWVDNGAPIGDRSKVPAYMVRVAGWQLDSEPDLIIPVSPKPIAVQADGELDYQHFKSEYVFKEEKWIQAIQILPGNHAIVHHILAFVESPNGRQVIGDLEGIDGYLAGYVPGLTIAPFPAGTAKRIPANSRLIFQVHYTPIGSPQNDHSKIGLYFADPDTVQREVITTSAIRRKLEIPSASPDHQVVAYSHRSLQNAMLLGMMPHMHLRGKAFRFELQSADGSTTPLLNVPRFDFHWQSSYRLTDPVPMQSGDRICCVAQFDNSADNPNNPDPTETIRWGDQTREEMMIGYFDIAMDRSDFESDNVDLKRHVVLVRVMDRYDKNRDGIIERAEVPKPVVGRFVSLDKNADSRVTFAELAEKWAQ